MKLLRGVLFLLVLATVVLLTQGRQGDRDAKKRKKDRQTDVAAPAGVADSPVLPVVTVVPNNQGAEPPTNGQLDPGIIPSEEHNGKLNKKDKAAKKAARKAAKKAEKKAAKKAERKAKKKAEKRRLRKEQKHQQQHQGAATPDKAARKAAKRAARKAARKQRKQQQLQQPGAAGEIVSFEDIVADRNEPPNPNQLPPVIGQPQVGDTATQSQNTAGSKENAPPAGGNKAERRRLRQEEKARKKQQKSERKQRKHHNQHVCVTNDDCGQGHCCVEKKGQKMCRTSRKDEGQKCLEDCMCRAGLSCVPEQIAPGREKRFCRVRGAAELGVDNVVGAVEDAVEDAINKNQ